MTEVLIIGAGITGLSCAWRLKRLGIETLVVEASKRAGGVIQSERTGGYLIEHGPNSFLPSPETFPLLDESGLSNRVVEGDRHAPRYICINRSLRKAPLGPMSIPGLMRAVAEPFIFSKSPADESIHDFVARRFGREAEERLASPFVTGIYAGNTRNVVMAATFPSFVEMERRYGSVMIGMLKTRKPKGTRTGHTSSFDEGMETLPRTLASELQIQYACGDIDIENTGARATVVTIPAYRAGPLLRGKYPTIAGLLEKVDYAPMVIALATLADSALPKPLRGFGFLVPRTERLHLLGTLFSSALFPGRAPAGRQLLTSFLGGALERDVIDWDDDRIWNIVRTELRQVLRTSEAPRPLRLIRRIHAIPQYNIGHKRWAAAVKMELASTTGLFLAGSYREGVSVSSCIETGERTARDVAAYLGKKS
jgi:oxygen-dependent protoporphyrinogen oxidase